jgi:hypothetical protein
MMGIMNRNDEKPRLTTADLAAASREQRDEKQEVRPDRPQARNEPRTDDPEARREPLAERRHAPLADSDASPLADDQLTPLFAPDAAGEFRTRWDAVQIGFVDDPAKAVRDADELVAAVLKSLADSFAAERNRFESQMAQSGEAVTENYRVALRRYRAFFHRLLSL